MEQKQGSNIKVWNMGRDGQGGGTAAFWYPKAMPQLLIGHDLMVMHRLMKMG